MDESLLRHIKKHREELLAIHAHFAEFLSRIPSTHHNFYYLVLRGALRRSYALARAFFDLVEAENYVAAAPLVRLELDNGLRIHLIALCGDSRKTLEHLAAGKRLDQLRDPDGHRFTDRLIVDALSGFFPWLPRLYDEGSRFIHFSDVHVFAFDDSDEVLPERDTFFSDIAYVELVESFVLAAKFSYDFVARFRVQKLRDWCKASARRHVSNKGRRTTTSPSRCAAILRRLFPAGAMRNERRNRETLERADALNASLIRILFAHGLLACRLESGWNVVDGRFPAIRTTLCHERSGTARTVLQLDVDVLLPDAIMRESFMGQGVNRAAAAKDAMHNFCVSSLHVMLAGIWDRIDPEHLDIDRWSIGGKEWVAYRGRMIIKCHDTTAVTLPPSLEGIIDALLRQRALAGTFHWFRMYFSVINHATVTVEALFDNQRWPDAEAAIRQLPWQITQDFFSIRTFYILRHDESDNEKLWSGFCTRDDTT